MLTLLWSSSRIHLMLPISVKRGRVAKEVGGVPFAWVGGREEKLVSFSLCSKKASRFAKIA